MLSQQSKNASCSVTVPLKFSVTGIKYLVNCPASRRSNVSEAIKYGAARRSMFQAITRGDQQEGDMGGTDQTRRSREAIKMGDMGGTDLVRRSSCEAIKL